MATIDNGSVRARQQNEVSNLPIEAVRVRKAVDHEQLAVLLRVLLVVMVPRR